MNHTLGLRRPWLSTEILALLIIVLVVEFLLTTLGLITVGIVARSVWAPSSAANDESVANQLDAADSTLKVAYAVEDTIADPTLKPLGTDPMAGSGANLQPMPSATATATATATKTKTSAVKTAVPKPTMTVTLANPVYKASGVSTGPGNCNQLLWFGGTVKDKSGKPIAGVSVRVTWKKFYADPAFGSYGEGSATAKSDANGDWKAETSFVNATYHLTSFSAVVVSDDGTKMFSPVVDFSLAGDCRATASATINFERQ